MKKIETKLSSLLLRSFKLSDHWFLLTLLLAGFVLRYGIFDAFGSNFYFVDVGRDYIVANHMVTWGEFPLTGPDGHFGPQSNGPTYYYLIAGLLLIFNNIFWPGFVNVFVQTASIVLVFYFARDFFGRRAAYVAATLFTFLESMITPATHMWQPYIMMPVLWVSFYLLYLGYTNGRLWFLVFSAVLYSLALLIHSSVLITVPLYFVALGFVLCKKKFTLVDKIKVWTALLLTTLVQFLPLIYYWVFHGDETFIPTGNELMYLEPDLPSQSISQILSNFFYRSGLYFTHVFQGTYDIVNSTTLISIMFFGVSLGLYFVYVKDKMLRIKLVIFLAPVVLLLLSLSFLNLSPDKGFPVRYFCLTYLPLLVVVGELVTRLFQKGLWRFFVPALVVVMVYYGTPRTFIYAGQGVNRLETLKWEIIYPTNQWPSDVEQLHKIIVGMSDGETEIIPFDIKTYKNDNENQYLDAFLWAPFENMFNVPVVKVDDRVFRNFSPVNDPQYVFIRCLELEEEVCKKLYEVKYRDKFKVDSLVYESDRVLYLLAVPISD